MAKLVEWDGKLPKRIDEFVIYPLGDAMIIREVSGFTTQALLKDPKYAKSRDNASEFGCVSATCKAIRVSLKELLPVKNNLAVVNSLNKKMRAVLNFDTMAVRGQRTLATALMNEEARQALEGYDFNPDANIRLDYELNGNELNIATAKIVFPEGANCIGFRIAILEFDFETKASQLSLGNWSLFGKKNLRDAINIPIREMIPQNGILFTLLEAQFYTEADGSYIPLDNDKEKRVVIVSLQ